MATLPNPTIDAVPQESTAVGAEYPALGPIDIVDLVAPPAANRQPDQLNDRSNTLRDRVNRLVENVNYISTGLSGGSLYVPRDGSEAMIGDLTLTSTTGNTRKVVIDSGGSSRFEAKAASGFSAGMDMVLNSVGTGSVYSQIVGGETYTTVSALTQTKQHVTLVAGGTTYDFVNDGATFNSSLTMSGTNRVYFSGAGNYIHAQDADTVVIEAAADMAVSVATSVKLWVQSTITTSYQNFQMNSTTYLYLNGTGNYIRASSTTVLTVNGGTQLDLATATTARMTLTNTNITAYVTFRMDGTTQIQFGGSGGFTSTLSADASDYLIINGGARTYIRVASTNVLISTATQTTSYQTFAMDADKRVQFNGANNYIFAAAGDLMAYYAGVRHRFYVATTAKFSVEAATTWSYQNLTMENQNQVVFGGSGAGTCGMYATGSDDLRAFTNVAFRVYVSGSNHFEVTSTAISAQTKKIQNVVDPTLDQDAATKKYVDDRLYGWKLNSQIDLSGTPDLSAVTVGPYNCDYDELEDAIDYCNSAYLVGRYYVIYVFPNTLGGATPQQSFYDITASKVLSRPVSIIGMGPRVLVRFSQDVTFTLTSSCVFENLDIQTAGTWTVNGPILSPTVSDVRFTNCWFNGGSGTGDAFTFQGSTDVFIKGCEFTGNRTRCCVVGGGHVTMEDCRFSTLAAVTTTIYVTGSFHSFRNLEVQCGSTYGFQCGVLSNCILSNIYMFTYSSAPTYFIYARFAYCAVEHVILEAAYGSSTYGLYEYSTGSPYTTFTGCIFINARVQLAGAGSKFQACTVRYTSSTTTEACVHVAGDNVQIQDCYLDRTGFNAACIVSNGAFSEAIVTNNRCDNTGTKQSIFGWGVGSDGWMVHNNMVDVATSANGGLTWTTTGEKVV